MKNLISSIAALFVFVQIAQSAVLTVSNDPADGAEYSDLHSAYEDAVDEDTLHLKGTHIAYHLNGIDWNKSLTVIGIGFNPDKTDPKLTFISTTSQSRFRLNSSASGSKFYGIVFTAEVLLNQACDDLLFENCRFDIYFNFNCKASNNTSFRNCIFNRNNDRNIKFGCSVSQSGLISNCVFDGYIQGNNSTLSNFVVEHSLFLSNPFYTLHNTQIRDCIFMNTFPSSTYNCEYLNNLSAVAGSFPPAPSNGNTGSGNIENQDPLFVNYTSGTYYSTNQDYHTQAGSPVENAASDGSDIGLHGGTTGFSEQGEVLINPIVRELNIQNTTVAPNGTLEVQIHATKPADN